MKEYRILTIVDGVPHDESATTNLWLALEEAHERLERPVLTSLAGNEGHVLYPPHRIESVKIVVRNEGV